MLNQSILWVALASYALHMMEEYFYDWKGWANNVLKLPVDWTGFYITNAAVLFLGIACAMAGLSIPWFALCFPALMLINACIFHIMPFILTRKFSPGLITAVVLFLPIGFYTFRMAYDLNVSQKDMLLAFLTGILLMAFPIVLLKTKDHSFFKQ